MLCSPSIRRSPAAMWPLLIGALALASVLLAFAAKGPGPNPRADSWSEVRQGVAGYTSVESRGHDVLIHNGGQNWRVTRNGLVAGLGPWVLAVVLAALIGFYIIVGKDRLEEPRSGILLERFSRGERILHWSTAILFVILALTGLSTLFGRAVLIPVFGQAAFAEYMQWGLWVHNVLGPVFLVGLLAEIAIWAKDNMPKRIDLDWFLKMGGMVGQGPRPHAEKENAGAKAWFWFMALAGIAMGVTGVILDFPIWGQARGTMQLAHLIHASVAILFIAASLGHIYMGTIGAEGTFEGMWRGRVDAVWAKQHQDLWYKEKMGGEPPASGK